jgi:alpha-tubulin suppressor-like RCC1 family protein
VAWAQPPEDLEADDLELKAHAHARNTLAAGENHNLSLAEDGTVWAWGLSLMGEVGTGFGMMHIRPVQVPQLSGIVSVAAGSNHSLALGADGRVWAWGDNMYGQLGLGDSDWNPRSTPTLVPGLTDVVAIAANAYHSLAVRADGSVWGWGDNSSGQLGIEWEWQLRSPTQVPGLSPTLITALATGPRHTLAVSQDGRVWSWGDSSSGQVGHGPRWERARPAPVPGLTDIVGVAAGEFHSLALRRRGTVMAWGTNSAGVLGIGASVPEFQPTPIPVPGLTHVRTLASSQSSVLALRRDGTVWGWGANDSHQLAQPSTEIQYVPVRLQGLRGVTAIANHRVQGLARLRDGSVWGWGNDFQAAVGTGRSLRLSPVKLPGIDSVVSSSIGPTHVLALRQDGSVWSWGFDHHGQRVTSPSTPPERPAPVEGISQAVAVASFSGSSLVLKQDGLLWAWGDNSSGQLGDGTRVSRRTPQPVPGLANLVAVSAGYYSHVLALSGDGRVWAWGQNNFGQLGDGTTTARRTPTLVPGLKDIIALSAGAGFSLALQRNGQVWAWGRNDTRQLGDGTTTSRPTPVLLPGLTDVVAISAGGNHALALRSDGTLWGWGHNRDGQLDPALPQNHLALPTPITGMTQVAQIAAGYHFSLALRADGSVWSWGNNTNGELGQGTQSVPYTRSPPAPVPGLSGVVSLSAAGWTAQAVLEDGTARAWGDNSQFLIGDGVSNLVPSPELVLPPPQHPPH